MFSFHVLCICFLFLLQKLDFIEHFLIKSFSNRYYIWIFRHNKIEDITGIEKLHTSVEDLYGNRKLKSTFILSENNSLGDPLSRFPSSKDSNKMG